MDHRGDRALRVAAYPLVLAPLAVAGVAMLASRLGASASLCFDIAWTASAFSALLGIRSALLGRRMRRMLERERAALVDLTAREGQLARLNVQLVEDSRRDPLTGISNRRALSDDLAMFEAVRRDQGASFAFALCDVDHFKSYNDRLGHLAGDQALRSIAGAVRGALRAGDAAYRFGGEELLLIFRDATVHQAARIAERVRGAVERAAIPHAAAEEGILTVSIGVAAGELDGPQLLAGADAALYEAKHRGRNCVVAANEGRAFPTGGRARSLRSQEPVPRHLRAMLAVSRAAAAARGPMPVLEALAETIHTELSFQVVAVNLVDDDRQALRVVLVRGDQEARQTLLGTSSSWSEWHGLLACGKNIHGAVWLQAGAYEWNSDAVQWTPPAVPALTADAWHPEDMLLLPLRGSTGELLAIISVDQPLLGGRPREADLGVLMAVADHAGLALEQARGERRVGWEESPELRLAAMMLLAETLDMRDPSTALHSRRVGEWARATALELGLDPRRVERVHAAGVLHDLGKVGISDAILQKPAELSEHEWEELKIHPQLGAQILENAGMRDIATWVRAHHERLDGRGYPAGLRDVEIPIEARVLAVADAYEAMVAERPYQSRMASADARDELLRCCGTHFDPVVVEAFLRVLEPDRDRQLVEVGQVR